jgi:hypothetical protein
MYPKHTSLDFPSLEGDLEIPFQVVKANFKMVMAILQLCLFEYIL